MLASSGRMGSLHVIAAVAGWDFRLARKKITFEHPLGSRIGPNFDKVHFQRPGRERKKNEGDCSMECLLTH